MRVALCLIWGRSVFQNEQGGEGPNIPAKEGYAYLEIPY
jgi:hypothetical protein